MDLSVIIVNYNVKYFLEQCLHAVVKSAQNIHSEIFVVDNNSVDDSVQMARVKFPQVRLITNNTNLGFAKANNQAIRLSSGRYILLLNPDTLVQEDTFSKCLEFMDKHLDIGCLGVKMIDGKGNFLPESKRALPTPAVAFYKMTGLSALFPHSKRFGRYHLGYLDKDEINDVDVISGAFMFLRHKAIESVGMFDEDFFMYGEDIDLSYRLKLSGYRNVYFPSTTIIHYKGESTKKGSINYVIMFYNAMIIFARKHFSRNTARSYSLFIHIAIYIRAGMSILLRFLKGSINPVLDALLIYAGYYFFLPVWETHLFGYHGAYPSAYLKFVVPAYIGVWLISVFLSTGYEKVVKIIDIAKGVIIGTIAILVGYALLPESLRFSRALILIGSFWALVSTIAVRSLLSVIFKNSFKIEAFKRKKRILIVGGITESNRVFSIIKQTQVLPELIGFVNPSEDINMQGYIGHIGQIEEIVKIDRIDELIFCANDMTSQRIITTMLQFTDSGIEFKIAPPESMSVIGSNSNSTMGELYVLHFNTLSRILNRRKKRIFDIILSLLFLVISPILVFLVKKPAGLLRNILYVSMGSISWVGYFQSTGGNHPGLPRIRPGVLNSCDNRLELPVEDDMVEKMNLLYAKDFRIANDLRIIFRGYRELGRKVKLEK
jgi:GT2 family glycosyltransferase